MLRRGIINGGRGRDGNMLVIVVTISVRLRKHSGP
jgi:hypothetical protein